MTVEKDYFLYVFTLKLKIYIQFEESFATWGDKAFVKSHKLTNA